MAHPRVIATRSDAARGRIGAAAAALGKRHGLKPELLAALEAYDRDPEMRVVVRQEAVADLLEALAAGSEKPAKASDESTSQPASATPQDAGAGGGESPPAPVRVAEGQKGETYEPVRTGNVTTPKAPAAPPRQHAAVRERAKARGK